MTGERETSGLAAELLAAEVQGEFLANEDMRHQDDIDREFLAGMMKIQDPRLEELDGRVRRALLPWCRYFWQQAVDAMSEEALEEGVLASVAIQRAFLKGYELGRRLRRPLTIQAAPKSRGR